MRWAKWSNASNTPRKLLNMSTYNPVVSPFFLTSRTPARLGCWADLEHPSSSQAACTSLPSPASSPALTPHSWLLCRVPSAHKLFLCLCRHRSLCWNTTPSSPPSPTLMLTLQSSRVSLRPLLLWHLFSFPHPQIAASPPGLPMSSSWACTTQFEHWSHGGCPSICMPSSLERQWAFSRQDVRNGCFSTDTQPRAWEHRHLSNRFGFQSQGGHRLLNPVTHLYLHILISQVGMISLLRG